MAKAKADRAFYNKCIETELEKKFGMEYAEGFKILMESGFEGGSMVEYFDTWNYLKDEAKDLYQEEWDEECKNQIHDVALSIYDALVEEGLGEASINGSMPCATCGDESGHYDEDLDNVFCKTCLKEIQDESKS